LRGQWLAEAVATFGLILTIFGGIARAPTAVPYAVGLYITSAYWFTASTSFANPAVTIARSLSDTFAGIAPAACPDLFLRNSSAAPSRSCLRAGCGRSRKAGTTSASSPPPNAVVPSLSCSAMQPAIRTGKEDA